MYAPVSYTHLTLCTALAGCGSASKTSTPAHAIAATGTTCSEESSDERIKECIVTLSETDVYKRQGGNEGEEPR